MAFIETPRFPNTIAAGAKFGPVYSSSISRNLGGYEQRNQNWTFPLYQGDIGGGVKTQEMLDELLAFFHGVAGMQNGFRFKNFNDFTVTGAQGTLVQLTSTTWQMYKTYTIGALTKARKILKPVTGAVIAGGGVYTVNTVTGVITKTSGADPTSWTGEFDTPVRFDTDAMLPTWLAYAVYDNGPLPIIELRTP